ncbi:probable threonine protease PRSS50 [Choloepus didactylus]|uniref:probable threonine protease PRSS50 n=1 Tax=Choloepus didactylus TaxID=27675 RepID=UPI0018A0BE04|nr:probable threonine protease PRSS50 [Choloepus didactylus]
MNRLRAVGCRGQELAKVRLNDSGNCLAKRDTRSAIAGGPWGASLRTRHQERQCGRPLGGAVAGRAPGAPSREEQSRAARPLLSGMEPRRGQSRQGLQSPLPSAPARAGARAVLLLLLLGPAGSLGAREAPEALSVAPPADPSAPCAPGTTCSLGRTPIPQLPETEQLQISPPGRKTNFQPSCGNSFEKDPTLRDPDAMARRWPWMVSVRANGTHVCAGTLIASKWVLTVAHCLTQQNVYYSVLVGSPVMDETSPDASSVPVLQVIVNREYRDQRHWSWIGRANDIGLLKLQLRLNYSNYVWPICLPGLDLEVKDGTLCSVTGWGLPKANGIWPQSRSIQEKEVTIMNNKQCDNFYHKFSKIPPLVQIITPQMICAEDNDRENFCYEMTGEPLACLVENTWYLVGVVSWGPGCKNGKAPPIYLHVSPYQVWIWDRLNGQPMVLLAPSRGLLLALPLSLSLLASL